MKQTDGRRKVKAVPRRRNEIATGVIVLIAVSAALIYSAYAQDGLPSTSTLSASGVSTVSAPGFPYDDSSVPSAAGQVELNSEFVQLSQGLCYNYIGESYGESQGASFAQYTFNYYNGTVFYPCGTFPAELVVGQIRVATPGNGSVSGESTFQFSNDTASLNVYDGCGPNLPPAGVVSAELVIVTIPAVPELSLTLSTVSAQAPIASLTAVLITSGANDTLSFAGVTPSTPALPGTIISQLELINGQVTLTTGGVYDMSIQGSYSDGQNFSYVVTVALVSS
jgi:hypothetical protein